MKIRVGLYLSKWRKDPRSDKSLYWESAQWQVFFITDAQFVVAVTDKFRKPIALLKFDGVVLSVKPRFKNHQQGSFLISYTDG